MIGSYESQRGDCQNGDQRGQFFRTRDKLNVGAQTFDIHRLEFLEKQSVADLAKLPFSLRILLENLLRCEDGRFVHAEDIRALANWRPGAPEKEIAFMPARVLLQDFTGVPAIVDLATMREAVQRMGGNPKRINPLFLPSWSSTIPSRSIILVTSTPLA